ncbi:MAG: transcriptional repressor [Lysobacter sp.]|nr:transcriptional repressor [Lysobacter sp.]
MSASRAHRHKEPRGAALIAAAKAAVEAAGEQWTALRASVFEALATNSKPASAYEVTEVVSRIEGRRVTANTVYRILDLFVSTNVALRIESANAYVANAHPGCQHDCIFFVCDGCGSAQHADDDRISDAVREFATESGFAPQRPVIEVRGWCGTCGQAKRA